jgi:solute:Na+ symporter, SSS family
MRFPVALLLALVAIALAPVARLEAAATARLEIQSEWAVETSRPVSLLRIGAQPVLLSPARALKLAPDGEVSPIPGGRDLRDFGSAFDDRSAFIAGGRVSGQPSDQVWRIQLASFGLEWASLAALPAPCVNPALALLGDSLFAIGQAAGNGAAFFVRINKTSGAADSLDLPLDLGDPLSLGAQAGNLYLLGRDDNGALRLWRRENTAWVRLRTIPPEGISPLPPAAIGPTHLFYAARNVSSLFSYHTITDTWVSIAGTGGTTLGVIPVNKGLGRVVQTEDGGCSFRTEVVAVPKRHLGFLDYFTLTCYFAANLGIGFWWARRRRDSDDFLRGGGRVQWWAAGLSYMVTGMSSQSLMLLPVAAFTGSWLLLGVAVFQTASALVVAIVFIPLLRRLNLTTVFEYLERRFGRAVRLLGAVLTVLGQTVARMSIVMLLPAMAFSAVTGLNVYMSILLMGGVTILYCLKGGLQAVIWADVFQFALMYGGIAVAVLVVSADVPGGLPAVIATAQEEGKFKVLLLDWDFVRPTVWVFVCLGLSSIFVQASEQPLMQRAFSTPDEKTARKCVMLGAVASLPAQTMLFFVGSALFVFYRRNPGSLDPALPTDSLFPYFVGNELPPGVVGVIVAAIFAAAMSTVSSSLNAISAIAVRDFLLPVRPDSPERTRMALARLATVVAGGASVAIALLMASMDIKSLWEMFVQLFALVGGGFPGIFALGMLTRRANAPGVFIGLLASIGATFAVRNYTSLNVFLYISVAVGTCIVVGYVASLFFAPPARKLDGLTVHTLRRERLRPGTPPASFPGDVQGEPDAPVVR